MSNMDEHHAERPGMTPEQRELRDAKRQRRQDEGRVAMADYKREQIHVQERTERLRAERLAREAQKSGSRS